MYQSKFILIVALLLSLSLLAIACSPAETSPAESSESTTQAVSEETAAETEPVETTSEAAETETQPSERVEIKIGALRGPTGIGLVHLMQQQDAGATAHDYTFSLAGAPDDIVASLTSGQIDIAALPTNLAAILYQKTNQRIRMLAVNTLGVLYILENGDQVQKIADLAGRQLEASGQAAVPEYALNYILAENDLTEAVDVVYQTEHAELATLAVSGQADLVMLPEPFVTTVLSKAPDFRIALDLTEEWQRAQATQGSDSELAMGCLVVSTDFAAAHPEALADFLIEYSASTAAVNADPQTAGVLVEQYEVMPDGELAARAIPNSNIVAISGAAMQPILEPFFQVLFDQNPQSIGGQLPDEEFYWIN